jgi:hypothetical protein
MQYPQDDDSIVGDLQYHNVVIKPDGPIESQIQTFKILDRQLRGWIAFNPLFCSRHSLLEAIRGRRIAFQEIKVNDG